MAEKVTFDGPNKLIIIKTGVTDLSVKDDIYIPWKQWVIDEGSMYLSAFRSFGGDPTTLNQNAPSYYFLTNNWRVKAENVSITLHENLYSDDYSNPFIIINSSVLSKNSDIPGIEGVNNELTGITSILTGISNDIQDIGVDVKLILGLSQHNYRLFNHVYDSGQRLLSVLIKLYNTSSDCNNDLNSFAQYQMNATYDSNGLLTDYKVVKV